MAPRHGSLAPAYRAEIDAISTRPLTANSCYCSPPGSARPPCQTPAGITCSSRSRNMPKGASTIAGRRSFPLQPVVLVARRRRRLMVEPEHTGHLLGYSALSVCRRANDDDQRGERACTVCKERHQDVQSPALHSVGNWRPFPKLAYTNTNRPTTVVLQKGFVCACRSIPTVPA